MSNNKNTIGRCSYKFKCSQSFIYAVGIYSHKYNGSVSMDVYINNLVIELV